MLAAGAGSGLAWWKPETTGGTLCQWATFSERGTQAPATRSPVKPPLCRKPRLHRAPVCRQCAASRANSGPGSLPRADSPTHHRFLWCQLRRAPSPKAQPPPPAAHASLRTVRTWRQLPGERAQAATSHSLTHPHPDH